MRWATPLLVGLTVAAWASAGCGGGPDEPTLDPSLLSALAPACAGQLVAGAGSVSTSSGSPNHMIMLDAAGEPFDWTEWVPTEWRPTSLSDTELVTCVTPEGRAVIEVCPYNGSDVTRYSVSRAFTVFEPSSGERVAHFSIVAEPRNCAPTENASLTELEGTIDQSMVTAHLASLVEHGVFVDPDVPGGSAKPGQTSEPGATVKPGATVTPGVASRSVELRQALRQGLVSVTGTGDGLQSLDLELTSEVDEELSVTIEPGTLVDPAARATQTMVVVAEAVVDLKAMATEEISLDVACAQMRQDQPSSSDSFTVRLTDPEADLVHLLGVPEFTAETFRVQQFAVWTITNDPKRNGYVGLTSGFEIYGSGPSDEELASIKALFESAGIDSHKYRALR